MVVAIIGCDKHDGALKAAAVWPGGMEVLGLLLGLVRAPRAARVAMEVSAEWGRREAFEGMRKSQVGRKVGSGVVQESEGSLDVRRVEVGGGTEERVSSNFDEGGVRMRRWRKIAGRSRSLVTMKAGMKREMDMTRRLKMTREQAAVITAASAMIFCVSLTLFLRLVYRGAHFGRLLP